MPEIKGSELIAFERNRQVAEEGWTSEHDATHDDYSLVMAAICYASCAALDPAYTVRHENSHASKHFIFRDPWPWDKSADKRPSGTPSREQQVRLLVKAGALIAAEIDRLRGGH